MSNPDTGPTLADVHEALQETRKEREDRLRALFTHFDREKKGAVDHKQLEDGFQRLEVPSHNKFAKELLEACDSNRDGRCDFHEFRQYMDSKEVELYTLFNEIDVSSDGLVHPAELEQALRKAGIELGDDELSRFVERIDLDHNGVITFSEWRDFLMLYPGRVTISNVYKYWEKECQVDIGEQPVIPEGLSHRQAAAWRYFLAGGVAGAVSRTATAPLDRLKIILQVHTGRDAPGVVQGLVHMYRQAGNSVRGFFVGNGLNVLKVCPESAIKFYSYELIKSGIRGDGTNGEIGTVGRLTAGGLAGAIAQTVVYPLDLIKTRMQTGPGEKPPRIPHLAKQILQREGGRAFYRGLTPSLIGMVPYAGIDLAAYESLKDLSRNLLEEGQDPGPWIQLACGTCSGAIGATAVYPLNVVRTRLQAQCLGSGTQYTGMVDVFKQTLEREGLRGFYKGLFPNLLKVAPAASITYVTYEEMKRHLHIQ